MTTHPQTQAIDVPTQVDAWVYPLSEAVAGNPALLADWLRSLGDKQDIPAEVRLFLADTLDGTIEKPVGRPEKRTGEKVRAILTYYFAKLEAQRQVKRFKHRKNTTTTPKERALASTGKRFGVSVGAVKRIVEDARKTGLTYDFWVTVDRPSFDTQSFIPLTNQGGAGPP